MKVLVKITKIEISVSCLPPSPGWISSVKQAIKTIIETIISINKNQDNLLLIINDLNINIMILKISNPRDAIIQSYSRPIAYKDYILLDGVVIIKFCKLGIWKNYYTYFWD